MTDSSELRTLRVTRKVQIAKDIHLMELRSDDEAHLPPFTAGAHLPIRVPNGSMRQYSLCSSPEVTDSYTIAVKREAKGRGGSISLVDGVAEGSTILAGEPRNLFALTEKAKSFILVAGGIGITPMIAMAHALQSEGLRSFKLYYLTRDEESTAFAEELRSPDLTGRVVIHHDHGNPSQSLDLWSVFENPINGTHVYCCGPQGLMDSVRDMTGHWPDSAIHFESFGADTRPHADDQPFVIELARTGCTLHVEAGQTILQVLHQNKVAVPSSCESGTCGSCKVGLLQGEADHRDQVLMPEERGDHVMVCVSRARGPKLVLDL